MNLSRRKIGTFLMTGFLYKHFHVRLLTPHQINPVDLVLKKPIIKKVPGFLQGLNPTLISKYLFVL